MSESDLIVALDRRYSVVSNVRCVYNHHLAMEPVNSLISGIVFLNSVVFIWFHFVVCISLTRISAFPLT